MWTSQALLDVVVAQSPASIITIGLDHRVVTWSPGAERLYGWTAAEAVGQEFRALAAPHLTHDDFEALLQRILTEGRCVIHDRRVRKDGSTFSTEATFAPVLDPEGKPAAVVGISRDVSEVMALRGREQFGTDERAAPAPGELELHLRPDGSIAHMNDRALATYGYSREEATQLHLRDLRLPGDDPKALELVRTAFESGLHFETVHRRRNGSVLPLEVYAHRADVAGQPRVQVIAHDISARVEVERERRQLAYLMRHLRDAIIQWDVFLRVVEWSGSAERLLGWTRAEALGLKLGVDLKREYPLGDGERVAAAIVAGEPVEAQVRMRRKDGAWVDLSVSAHPLRDEQGRLNGWLSEGRDLGPQLRLEAERDESIARLRTVVASLSEGLLVVGADGRVLMSNAAAARILGVAQADLDGNGKPLEGWATCDEAGHRLDDDAAPIGRVLRTGVAVHSSTVQVTGPGQAPRWLTFNAEPLTRSPEATPWAVVVTFTDVTEARVQAQERESLAERRHEAEKLDSLRSMAAGVAHHFNNKLMAVIGNLELLVGSVGPDDAPLVRDASQAARDAAAISGQLLHYLGQGFTRAEPHRLRSDLVRFVALEQPKLPRSVRLELAAGDDDPLVRLEQRALRRIFTSLVANAVEASEHRGGLVRVSWGLAPSPPPNVPSSSAHRGAWALLTVADDGEGMDEEVRKHVFEPFFSTRFPGRGLGLPVSWGIVRGLGGTMTVESELGRGTTVRTWLPVAAQDAHAGDAAPGEEVRGQGVLLIDDDPLVLATSVRLLERSRRELHVAVSGVEAVSLLRQHRARLGLALVDFHMPGLAGWSLLRALREVAPEVKLAVITGSDAAALEARQRDEHVALDGWLQKPFGQPELDALLGRLFSG